VAAGEIDAVVFTSAPGAHAWFEAADEAGIADDIATLARRGSVVMAAVGPITAKPLLDRGIEPLVPERGRLGALVRTLVGHYGGLQALQTVAGPLQVHRGAAVLDGHVLALTPTSLEVLRLLAAAGGAVVPRDQVLAALPGDSLDPHAAEVAIARLRDATGSRQLIRTVVKRAYRLRLEEV
jgi:uroporphyrinogen-III synthase